MNAVTLKQLNKSFAGKGILQGLDLTIPTGSIYGFVGENGAGKTTTLKILLGLLPTDSGEVTLYDKPVLFGKPLPQQVGYLPDVPSFYPYMKAKEQLHYAGSAAGMSANQIKERRQVVLQQVGLAQVNKRIGSYSRGMKQRLGLAQALLTNPPLLICDEPTSALDPLGRKAFLEIFQQLKGQTTVLFSTHLLTDVEAICDQVAILHEGKIALAGNLEELKASHSGYTYELTFHQQTEARQFQNIAEKSWPTKLLENKVVLVVADPTKASHEILATLAHSQLVPTGFQLVQPSLEELFLKVVQG